MGFREFDYNLFDVRCLQYISEKKFVENSTIGTVWLLGGLKSKQDDHVDLLINETSKYKSHKMTEIIENALSEHRMIKVSYIKNSRLLHVYA